MKSELVLRDGMAKNYIALQNFLSNIVPTRTSKRRSGNYAGSAKNRARKRFLLSLQNFSCFDCHVKFEEIAGTYPAATADHIIPHRFGSTLDHNCEFVCNDCNQKRKNSELENIVRYFGSIEDHNYL